MKLLCTTNNYSSFIRRLSYRLHKTSLLTFCDFRNPFRRYLPKLLLRILHHLVLIFTEHTSRITTGRVKMEHKVTKMQIMSHLHSFFPEMNILLLSENQHSHFLSLLFLLVFCSVVLFYVEANNILSSFLQEVCYISLL